MLREILSEIFLLGFIVIFIVIELELGVGARESGFKLRGSTVVKEGKVEVVRGGKGKKEKGNVEAAYRFRPPTASKWLMACRLRGN